MSIAVTCALGEGVILGVDSAVAISASRGRRRLVKIYENAEKLFQLGRLPIGIAIYGLGTIGNRGIGSYIHEFETTRPDIAGSRPVVLREVIESLRAFFMDSYARVLIPELERSTRRKFATIPEGRKPCLGLVVGGFSDGEYLPEVWHVLIPHHDTPGSASLVRPQGDFGTTWFAMYDPIRRYIKGIDRGLERELLDWFRDRLGRDLSADELAAVDKIIGRHEYEVHFDAMPLPEGIAHTRFLIDLVINHYRFASGAPVVGGRAKLGIVTYRGRRFEVLPD